MDTPYRIEVKISVIGGQPDREDIQVEIEREYVTHALDEAIDQLTEAAGSRVKGALFTR